MSDMSPQFAAPEAIPGPLACFLVQRNGSVAVMT